jgi:hypothetical protein
MAAPQKKSAMFTARIAPETRAALEAAARASGKSLSQEIEERLQESLAGSRMGLDKQPDHVQALAALVVLLTEKIEGGSGFSWRTDSSVTTAIEGGVKVLLRGLFGEGWNRTPDQIRDWIKSVLKSVAPDPSPRQLPLSAQRFGAMTAAGFVYHLLSARSESVLTSLSDADVARLAWVREKLATKTPPDPRDWGELGRAAEEALAAWDRPVPMPAWSDRKITEPKDEEKQS